MEGSESAIVSMAKAILFWAIFQGLFFTGGFSFLFPMLPSWGVGLVMGSVITVSILLLTVVFLKFDVLTMKDLGMAVKGSSFVRFVIALLAGCIVFTGFYMLYSMLTPVVFAPVEDARVLQLLVLNSLLFIVLGTMEEVAFRGYLLKKLEAAIGVRGAIYITSILFGLYHGLSIESLAGPAIWGLFYGVLAYWSKGLAIPIGFHVGLNLVQGLCSEKTKWVDGIWAFELVQTSSLLTIEQLTLLLQGMLLVSGIVVVEYYLRMVRNQR